MSAPQPLLERRELAEQAPRRGALHYLYCVSNRNGGRDTRKQVDVVRLDLLGHDQPFAFRANRISACSTAFATLPVNTSRRYFGHQTTW